VLWWQYILFVFFYTKRCWYPWWRYVLFVVFCLDIFVLFEFWGEGPNGMNAIVLGPWGSVGSTRLYGQYMLGSFFFPTLPRPKSHIGHGPGLCLLQIQHPQKKNDLFWEFGAMPLKNKLTFYRFVSFGFSPPTGLPLFVKRFISFFLGCRLLCPVVNTLFLFWRREGRS
jgi:hypothetical protein